MSNKLLKFENNQTVFNQRVAFGKNVTIGHGIGSPWYYYDSTLTIAPTAVPFTLAISGTDCISLPMGTTEERPENTYGLPLLRFNTTLNTFEVYIPTGIGTWATLNDSSPGDNGCGELISEVNKNTTDITTLSGEFTSLTILITSNSSSITTINTDIDILNVNITNNRTSITNIYGDLESIETTIGDIEDLEGDLTELSDTVDANTSDLTDIKESYIEKFSDGSYRGANKVTNGSSGLRSIDIQSYRDSEAERPTGIDSVLIGGNNKATGSMMTILGTSNNSSASYSQLIGSDNEGHDGMYMLLMGTANTATESEYNVVVGSANIIQNAIQTIILGNESTSKDGEFLTTIGNGNHIEGDLNTTMGSNNNTIGQNNTILAYNRLVRGNYNIILDSENDGVTGPPTTEVRGSHNVTVGGGNEYVLASGGAEISDTVQIGHSNTLSANRGIVIGHSNGVASGIVIGQDSNVTHMQAIGIGRNLSGKSHGSVLIGGDLSTTNSTGGIMIGTKDSTGNSVMASSRGIGIGVDVTISNAPNSTAIGGYSKIRGSNSVAIGYGSEACVDHTKNNATAVGYNCKARASNSTAIGVGITNNTSDSVEIGSNNDHKLSIHNDGRVIFPSTPLIPPSDMDEIGQMSFFIDAGGDVCIAKKTNSTVKYSKINGSWTEA